MNNIEKKLQLSINDFDIYKAEEIIEKELAKNNKNIELWVRLAVTV